MVYCVYAITFTASSDMNSSLKFISYSLFYKLSFFIKMLYNEHNNFVLPDFPLLEDLENRFSFIGGFSWIYLIL